MELAEAKSYLRDIDSALEENTLSPDVLDLDKVKEKVSEAYALLKVSANGEKAELLSMQGSIHARLTRLKQQNERFAGQNLEDVFAGENDFREKMIQARYWVSLQRGEEVADNAYIKINEAFESHVKEVYGNVEDLDKEQRAEYEEDKKKYELLIRNVTNLQIRSQSIGQTLGCLTEVLESLRNPKQDNAYESNIRSIIKYDPTRVVLSGLEGNHIISFISEWFNDVDDSTKRQVAGKVSLRLDILNRDYLGEDVKDLYDELQKDVHDILGGRRMQERVVIAPVQEAYVEPEIEVVEDNKAVAARQTNPILSEILNQINSGDKKGTHYEQEDHLVGEQSDAEQESVEKPTEELPSVVIDMDFDEETDQEADNRKFRNEAIFGEGLEDKVADIKEGSNDSGKEYSNGETVLENDEYISFDEECAPSQEGDLEKEVATDSLGGTWYDPTAETVPLNEKGSLDTGGDLTTSGTWWKRSKVAKYLALGGGALLVAGACLFSGLKSYFSDSTATYSGSVAAKEETKDSRIAIDRARTRFDMAHANAKYKASVAEVEKKEKIVVSNDKNEGNELAVPETDSGMPEGEGVSYTFSKIQFDFDSALPRNNELSSLLPEGYEKEGPIVCDVFGSADLIGHEKYNKRLSERRAESARKATETFFVEKGVEVKFRKVKGLGEQGSESLEKKILEDGFIDSMTEELSAEKVRKLRRLVTQYERMKERGARKRQFNRQMDKIGRLLRGTPAEQDYLTTHRSVSLECEIN